MNGSVARKNRNPGEAEEDARRKVKSMLPQDETRIGWSELEKKARSQRMSLRTLRKHLDELEVAGGIGREVDTAARPPRVYYQLMTSKLFPEIFDQLPPLMLDTKRWVSEISQINRPGAKERALRALLELQTHLLSMEMERIWQRGATFDKDQQVQGFIRIMIATYLAPIIFDIGVMCRAYPLILPEILAEFFKAHKKNYNKASSELMAILNAAKVSQRN